MDCSLNPFDILCGEQEGNKDREGLGHKTLSPVLWQVDGIANLIPKAPWRCERLEEGDKPEEIVLFVCDVENPFVRLLKASLGEFLPHLRLGEKVNMFEFPSVAHIIEILEKSVEIGLPDGAKDYVLSVQHRRHLLPSWGRHTSEQHVAAQR